MARKDNRRAVGPLNIRGILPDVTKESMKKRGFAEGRLITDWEQIVGADLAKHCSPHKLSFTRGKRAGGTLYIHVYGSLATELQHMEPLILERISTFFGYQAVNQIKLINSSSRMSDVRDTSVTKKTSYSLAHKEVKMLDKMLNNIDDPGLKDALRGLGKEFLMRNNKRSGE